MASAAKAVIGKIVSIFLPICAFVISGFEHCVANMYYFSIAGMWSMKTLGYVLVMTFGNAVGGVLIPVLRGRLDMLTPKV